MPFEALMLVLGSALIHATWNAFAKARGGDPIANAYLIGFGAGLVGLIALPFTGLPDRAAWFYVAISATVSSLYYPLIGYSYRVADMSAAYPLIRGGSPLFTAILGTAVLGEVLSPGSWGGVVLLSAGIIGLGADGLIRGGLTRAGIVAALSASAIIVSNNLVDAQGARLAHNPAGYVLMGNAITLCILAPMAYATRRNEVAAALKKGLPFALLAGCLVNGSYALVVAAMTMAPVGLVAAMRETSVLIGTIIAAVVLKEQFGPLRWVAALAIVGGLVLIRVG